mgnify:CR=1 FL=1
MNTDLVLWGSLGAVVISIIIIGYLGFKIKALMERDARSHKH